MPAGSGLIAESMFSLCLLFIAFGVALDPRQGKIFGPVLAPFIIGLALGMLIFASSGLAPGYTGAGMNAARCIGSAAASGEWKHHWVYWLGPVIAVVVHTIIYKLAPPTHNMPKEDADVELVA